MGLVILIDFGYIMEVACFAITINSIADGISKPIRDGSPKSSPAAIEFGGGEQVVAAA
jgi:hypothetical protein